MVISRQPSRPRALLLPRRCFSRPPTHFLWVCLGEVAERFFASLFVTVRSYFIILGSSWINFSLGHKQIVLLLCCWRGGVIKSKKNCEFLTVIPLVYFVCTVITHFSLFTRWGLKLKVKIITQWIARKMRISGQAIASTVAWVTQYQQIQSSFDWVKNNF